MTPRLILASTSPRRRELLGLLGLPFEVVASRYDEALVDPLGIAPDDYVRQLAQGKAAEVAGRMDSDALIIGADTTVVLDGRVLKQAARCRRRPPNAADTQRAHPRSLHRPLT